MTIGTMRRALLLEDSKSCAIMAMRILLAMGYAVELYDDIYRARMACAKKDFAFYIVDINVRDGSGLKFVEWLKGTHSRPRVILWTSQPCPAFTPLIGSTYAKKDADGASLRRAITDG